MNMQSNIQAAQAQPQRISEILSQVAVVVNVSSTSIGLLRVDKKASIESDKAHQARLGAGKTLGPRLAGAEDRVKNINSAKAACAEVVEKYTTAWGKRRLLNNVNIQPMFTELGAPKAEYDRLVDLFANDAPWLVANAENNKGTYDVPVPTIEECRSAFSLTIELEQIPDSESFSAKGMSKEIEEELKRRFEASMASAYQQAQEDAMRRLQKPLSAIVERMAAYNQRMEDQARGIKTNEGKFHDTLVTNLQEIAGVFDSFNLTGDPTMKAISAQLAAFDNLEPDDLKKSKQLRDDTAKRAKAILDGLGDWLN